MKTTKKLLLDIYAKDSCNEFNDVIRQLLTDNLIISDTTEFTILQKYLDRLGECSSAQISLLESIGIKKDVIWERNQLNPKNEKYYYLERDMRKGYYASSVFDFSEANMNYTFESKLKAEQEAKILNLFMVMRNWANTYNKHDGFVSKWDNPYQLKWGLYVGDGAVGIVSRYLDMELFFNIAVSSEKRAKEFRDEFKSDILEITKFI